MLYFDYYNHFWTDNLLYGEYKKETIDYDSNNCARNILLYEKFKEKYRMVWLDIILCCVVLSRHNIVRRWLNEMPPNDDIRKVAFNACIYGNNKIIILCKKHIPRELGHSHLFYKIFKRGDYATLSAYYELYPDELKNISKIKIGTIIAGKNMDITKLYMDNYDHNTPGISELGSIYKDIWFFYNHWWCINKFKFYEKFKILKYILLHKKIKPYIDVNVIKRLGVILLRLNKAGMIQIYILIRKLLYNSHLRNIYGILHVNRPKSLYNFIIKNGNHHWSDKYRTSISDLRWHKTLLL